MTYDLDDSIGMLLARLKELGLEEKTLVVFTSDNGGTPNSPQEPLRGNKGCYYEGGIREPFIVRWPGVVKPGTKCDVPVINVDLFPTFLAAAGAKPPQGKILDGESLLPLLRQSGELQRPQWNGQGRKDAGQQVERPEAQFPQRKALRRGRGRLFNDVQRQHACSLGWGASRARRWRSRRRS